MIKRFMVNVGGVLQECKVITHKEYLKKQKRLASTDKKASKPSRKPNFYKDLYAK